MEKFIGLAIEVTEAFSEPNSEEVDRRVFRTSQLYHTHKCNLSKQINLKLCSLLVIRQSPQSVCHNYKHNNHVQVLALLSTYH